MTVGTLVIRQVARTQRKDCCLSDAQNRIDWLTTDTEEQSAVQLSSRGVRACMLELSVTLCCTNQNTPQLQGIDSSVDIHDLVKYLWTEDKKTITPVSGKDSTRLCKTNNNDDRFFWELRSSLNVLFRLHYSTIYCPPVCLCLSVSVSDEMTGAIVVWRQLLMSPVFVMRGGGWWRR